MIRNLSRGALMALFACVLAPTVHAQLLPSGGAASNITQVGGSSITLGSKTSANSLPVVIASDQGAVPVSGTVSITANSSVNLNQVGGSALALGQTTMTASIPVTLASNQSTLGANIAQINAVTPLMGNGVTGTGSQRVTIASDNTAFNIISTPKTSCGTTVASVAWVAVPTVAAAPSGFTSTTCLWAVTFTNTNGTNQSVTVTDGQGSPITLIATYSIPGNSTAIFPLYGTAATTGIKWVAGGTGVTGSALGFQ